jgi:hypothetical protein
MYLDGAVAGVDVAGEQRAAVDLLKLGEADRPEATERRSAGPGAVA